MKKNSKGRFIVIEGIDSSGKNTQFKLLKKRLKKEVKKLKVVEFPRYYDSIWGEMLSDFMNGRYGRFKDIHPKMAMLMYMLDEYTWGRDIGEKWLNKGYWILSDRFFTSNVHQIAKYKTNRKKKFRDWLWKAGYQELGILKPDLVIFLDVNPTIARELLKNRKADKYLIGKKKDIAERVFQHQVDSFNEYLFTVEHQKFWRKVRCTTAGEIDKPDLIHERVWEVIKSQI